MHLSATIYQKLFLPSLPPSEAVGRQPIPAPQRNTKMFSWLLQTVYQLTILTMLIPDARVTMFFFFFKKRKSVDSPVGVSNRQETGRAAAAMTFK